MSKPLELNLKCEAIYLLFISHLSKAHCKLSLTLIKRMPKTGLKNARKQKWKPQKQAALVFSSVTVFRNAICLFCFEQTKITNFQGGFKRRNRRINLRPLNAAMCNKVSKRETSLFPCPDPCSTQGFKKRVFSTSRVRGCTHTEYYTKKGILTDASERLHFEEMHASIRSLSVKHTPVFKLQSKCLIPWVN